jgi:hydrogenase 3 maturation protease
MESWSRIIFRDVRRAARVAVVGVGNIARGDDAAGVLVAQGLLAALAPGEGRALVIAAGEVPENYTGTVRAFGPDLVVLIDSAGAGRRPGSIFIVDRAAIADDDVSTHRLPLTRIARYLEETMSCRVLILGLEPASFEGTGMSPAVGRAVRKIVALLDKALAADG